MRQPKLVGIIPSYDNFGYVRRAVDSFLVHTPDAVAVLVDDASPEWDADAMSRWGEGRPPGRLIVHRFAENGGVTRSWNWGLERARELGAEYAVVTNSDVLFAPGWIEGMEHALDHGWDLVGPLTNAPGRNPCAAQQDVTSYVRDYRLTDDAGYLEALVGRLRTRFSGETVPTGHVNGFLQAARTESWWANRLDDEHVFDPRLPMIGSEDELQLRLLRRGGRLGIALSSFVFHYRGVSRGNEDRGYYRARDPGRGRASRPGGDGGKVQPRR